jgi:CYTH domain-containing protein
MGMEIERKFIPITLPENLDEYKHYKIEQAYLNTAPVVRIRQQGDEYYLTYKGGGMMAREEYNLPLNKKSYHHLLSKADGNIITKTRYLIPINNGTLTAELDIFEDKFKGMLLVEVEFESVEQADGFQKPDWFGEDVTHNKRYHNSYLSMI